MRNLHVITEKHFDSAVDTETLLNEYQGVRFMSRLDLKSGF